jgi:thioredoxin reductase (NADPH)
MTEGNAEAIRDIAILGAGPAGLTAAIYASRALRTVAVIEKGVPGGQIAMTDLIENYPGFPDGISGMELMTKFEEQARRFGAEFINLFEVASIGRDGSHFILADPSGRTLKARTVIIATGQQSRQLNVPGEAEFTGRGVSYCATCDGAFFRDRKVVVVGGGNSAIQEALYLTRFASSVTVVHRRDALRADRILQERAFANEKISFAWDSVVISINGDTKVDSVTIRNVKTGETSNIETDGVFIYIGYNPNTSFLAGTVELDEAGYVITDDTLQTSVPGIFACGDVRANHLKQVSVAVGEGALAAVSAETYLENLE